MKLLKDQRIGITKLLTICTTLESFEKIKTIIKKINDLWNLWYSST